MLANIREAATGCTAPGRRFLRRPMTTEQSGAYQKLAAVDAMECQSDATRSNRGKRFLAAFIAWYGVCYRVPREPNVIRAQV